MTAAVAAQLRAERAALDIKAIPLADESGIEVDVLLAMEAGEAIDFATLEVVVEKLQLTFSEFLRRAERRLPGLTHGGAGQQGIGVIGDIHGEVNIEVDNSRDDS
ncbi:MAG: hypothetical protein QM714_00420 [Nocardioides sp.]|uniref:hypothetical protein n=1 Tax=Nocardioides sp. TaxID=35761 RepID=UPI0039E6AA4B